MSVTNVKRRFGTSVRAWRARRAISQEELAARAGLHRTYVADIERGARNVSLGSIEKLATALEVSVAALFADSHPGGIYVTGELVDILLVEDTPDDVNLTLQALKEANFSNAIHVVGDGAEALHFLFRTGSYSNRHPGHSAQLVLLDLELPKIHGLEVLRRIKSDPRTNAIPVVVLTASRRNRDALVSQRLGADGYIIKPVDFQNLSEVTPQLDLRWALLKSGAPVPGLR